MYRWHGLAIGSSAEPAHALRNICPAGVHEVRDCAQLHRRTSGTGCAVRPDEVMPACAGVIATEWSAGQRSRADNDLASYERSMEDQMKKNTNRRWKVGLIALAAGLLGVGV
jgi:hypothetical protein